MLRRFQSLHTEAVSATSVPRTWKRRCAVGLDSDIGDRAFFFAEIDDAGAETPSPYSADEMEVPRVVMD